MDAPTTFNPFGQSLSDKVVGAAIFGEVGATASATRLYVRHNMVDQLTYDPMFGSTNVLAGDGAVVLAWGSDPLLDVEVEDQKPRHLGNVLYYLPADLDDPWQDHVPCRPAALHRRRHRRADLLEGPDVDQLRPRQRDDRLSARSRSTAGSPPATWSSR